MSLGVARTRGRGEDRRAGILAAATALFLERGFAGTSTDAIVERGGGSKETVYAHFGSKAGLFHAVIAASSESTLAAIEPAALDAGEPKDVLRAIALSLLTEQLKPQTLALNRLIIAESDRIPAIRDVWCRSGPPAAEPALVAYLERCAAAGTLDVPDPAIYAMAFGSLVLWPLISALVTLEAPAPDEIREHVDRTLPLFLRLCGVHVGN